MLQQRFLNNVIIITGSSAGIGQHAAIEFAKEGARVVIHGRDAKRLDETEKRILIWGVPAQSVLKIVGSIEDGQTVQNIVENAIKTFGRIDVLINNAAVTTKPGEESFSLASLDYIYRVNFRSLVNLTLLALPHLEETKGTILNISSIGAIRQFSGLEFYCTMKAALDHWTRAMALKCGEKGIRVNSFNPGPISDTLIAIQDGKRVPLDEKYGQLTVFGRMGHPSEMSTVMKFLCSEEASYITGACIVADGGMALCPSKI